MIEENLSYSFLREGNRFLLYENSDAAVNFYLMSSLSYDPYDIEDHEIIVREFYEGRKLNAVIEQNRVILQLQDDNAQAHGTLASMLHVRACIELDSNDRVHAHEYLVEAKNHFDEAVRLSEDSVTLTEYASFLWSNKNYYENTPTINMLLLAIKLSKSDDNLIYTLITRPGLDFNLQYLLDEYHQIFLKAVCYAYYLLITIYCETDQVHLAVNALEDFKSEVTKINDIDREGSNISSRLIENRLLEISNKAVLASKQAEIEAALSKESSSPLIEAYTSAPPCLLRDSPIISGNAVNNKIETDLEVVPKTFML